jgi:hypothetical protein
MQASGVQTKVHRENPDLRVRQLGRCAACRERSQRWGFTSVTAFIRLFASTTSFPVVTEVLRTILAMSAGQRSGHEVNRTNRRFVARPP